MIFTKIKKKFFLIIASLFIIALIWLFPTVDNKKNNSNNVAKPNDYIFILGPDNYVSRVSIYINGKTFDEKITEIINYLIINTQESSHLKEGFNALIPENTKLLSYVLDNKTLKLNFSKEILNIQPDKEEQMLSSLIYSLTNLEEVENITIFIENNILERMPNSKKKLDTILDRSFGVNHKYNLTSINNLTQTTIYYLSKNNDFYYYVPVSLIKNDDNEKINIIIEELSSKSVYQSNFISYINNIKNVSYEIFNDYIMVYLLNSNEAEITESIIYSINLSIRDNYNINKVIYLINNNIYKEYEI